MAKIKKLKKIKTKLRFEDVCYLIKSLEISQKFTKDKDLNKAFNKLEEKLKAKKYSFIVEMENEYYRDKRQEINSTSISWEYNMDHIDPNVSQQVRDTYLPF